MLLVVILQAHKFIRRMLLDAAFRSILELSFSRLRLRSTSKWNRWLSDNGGITGGVAGRYAAALFELAQELPDADRASLASDVASFGEMLSGSEDLQKLVNSPLVSSEEQSAALDAVLAKVGSGQIIRNFIALVVRKRRAMALADMVIQFEYLMADARNEVVAQITSAKPLIDTQIQEIKDELAKVLGKTIRIEAEVDPSLLGGLIVKAGSRMVDGSLKTKLNSLKQAMSEAG